MHSEVIAYQIADAIRVSGCTRSRLYEAMRDGELPYRKMGRRTLIMRTDLEAWLERASSRPVRQSAEV